MTAAKKHTNEDIWAQLNKILQNIEFKASDKQRQFLSYVVGESLEGRTSHIKGYTIAVEVYGRTETFDPQMDPIVRVEAGRLRRALDHYYFTAGSNDPLRITIPKGAYVPAFHSAPMQPPKDKTHTPGSSENRLSGEPIIAVMPLINLAGEVEQEYFADGLTEEMTTELARYQDIRVIASHSTMRFKGRKIDPTEVGRDLGARYLLTGSIRTDLKTIKVTIRLLDTSTVEQAWGKSYKLNRTAGDLITVQEKIAYSVVGIIADQYGMIKRRLSRESRKKEPANLDAYDATLQFYRYEMVLTPEAFGAALSALERAIKIDPDYGLAWAMIGHLHADNYALGFREIEAPLKKALNYVQKGVALDPQNQFVHDALALVYFHQGDKASFMQQAEKTIALNPNSPYIVGVAGWHMLLFGEWDQGLALLEEGMKLNPFYPTWFHLSTFMNCYRLGHYEDAYAEALKFNVPKLFWDPLMRAVALGQMGRMDEAASAVEQLLELEKDFKIHGRDLISRYVQTDELMEMIIKGLRKADLNLLE